MSLSSQASCRLPTGYWAWILAIVVIAVVATAGVYLRKPEALERAGTVGPEFVHEES